MSRKVITSKTNQTVELLRQGISQSRWGETLPGRNQLTKEFGCSHWTIDQAVRQLEKEGYLIPQGAGRRRKINLEKQSTKSPVLEVKIVLYERADMFSDYVSELRLKFDSIGHRLSLASKTLMELKQNPKRLAKMVETEPASAWIILAGSRPVLEWFARSGFPSFACFGSMENLPIAGTGPRYLPALTEALHILFDHGHHKIVMLTREERRRDKPAILEQFFIDKLKAQNISTGSFNLPEWEESAEGLRQCLDSLFKVTPPSAIFVGDRTMLLAIKSYLAIQRGPAPRQVALICMGYNPSFDWCDPPIAHFKWDRLAVVPKITQWANNVAKGKEDQRQRLTLAKFIGAHSIAVSPSSDGSI